MPSLWYRIAPILSSILQSLHLLGIIFLHRLQKSPLHQALRAATVSALVPASSVELAARSPPRLFWSCDSSNGNQLYQQWFFALLSEAYVHG